MDKQLDEETGMMHLRGILVGEEHNDYVGQLGCGDGHCYVMCDLVGVLAFSGLHFF